MAYILFLLIFFAQTSFIKKYNKACKGVWTDTIYCFSPFLFSSLQSVIFPETFSSSSICWMKKERKITLKEIQDFQVPVSIFFSPSPYCSAGSWVNLSSGVAWIAFFVQDWWIRMKRSNFAAKLLESEIEMD